VAGLAVAAGLAVVAGLAAVSGPAAVAGPAAAGIEHSLPWYFGVFVIAAWSGLMAVLVSLTRRRLRALRERRTSADRARSRDRVRDDESLGPGSDVERW
jgi:hypothetical protein